MRESTSYIQEILGQRRVGHKHRTDRKSAKALLLAGQFMWDGKLLDPRIENIGLGVVDVFVKEWEG